ncbi:cytochrome P450 89A9-like [Wolffia australiana]
MSLWAIVLALFLLFSALFFVIQPRGLPPGPLALPLVGNLIRLTCSISDFESVLARLCAKYGPIVTIQLGSVRVVVVTEPELAHEMFVRRGAVSADRPSPFKLLRSLTPSLRNINTSGYGPMWLLLRRNLVEEILQAPRVKNSADARAWAVQLVFDDLRTQAETDDGIVNVIDTFQYALVSLFILLCFGVKLAEPEVREIAAVEKDFLQSYRTLNVFAYAPGVSGYLFRGRVKRLIDMQQRQKTIFLPLISSRRQRKEERDSRGNSVCYLDL